MKEDYAARMKKPREKITPEMAQKNPNRYAFDEASSQYFERQSDTPRPFKDYIIKNEPVEEVGIFAISGVWILSEGNLLLLTGPMKSRKTRLATILINQAKLKTAYLDTEQGKKHSYLLSKGMPTADVYHLRGENHDEIIRVLHECTNSGEYKLIVIDNIRDLMLDFNDVKESGKIELLMKKVTEKVPVLAILHENKNNSQGQGHAGHGLGKIAQTTIRTQLVDVEDPAKGSYVECVRSRDEPFNRAFISVDGILSEGNKLLKTGGRSMLIDDFFIALGNEEYTHNALLEKIGDLFGLKPSSARNSFAQIRKAWPNAFSERKEGKLKFFRCCIDNKMQHNAVMR